MLKVVLINAVVLKELALAYASEIALLQLLL
jgi:hypothetical protein